MTNLSFENLKPQLNQLRTLGLYQIDSQSSKVKKTLHRFYMAFVLVLISIYTLQQMIKMYQVRDNVNQITDTMVVMLTSTNCVFKLLLLWKRRDKIEGIFEILKDQIFNQKNGYHHELLQEQGHQSKRLLKVYSILALMTWVLWCLFPLILYHQNKHVEFTIYLPFDATSSPQFYIALSYVSFQLAILATASVALDSFITFFFSLSKTQLSILRFELANVVKQSKKEAEERSMPLAEIFHSRFEHILLLYNKIVSVCSGTENIFGGFMLYLFIVSGWIIGTTAYRIIDVDLYSIKFLSLIMYMNCMLIQIFMYCYYGNEVAYESDQLLASAFTMEWYDIPLEYRNSLIIFMERLKRPIVPTAGTIIPLSNTTFISILRTSYTFYAFLQNTK